jgi:hypothetical protein
MPEGSVGKDAAVPEAVLNRFCQGYEPRPDVLGGQLVRRHAPCLSDRATGCGCPSAEDMWVLAGMSVG